MKEYEKIVFGNYKGYPIEWRVLRKDEDSVFLLSEYALDNYCFNEKFKHVKWKDCTLRNWLNTDFHLYAFSDQEKSLIMPVEHGDERYIDYVFCLNITECLKYLPSEEDRSCYISEYVRTKKEEVWSAEDDCCIWWLRSVAYGYNHAIYVEHHGQLDPYSRECIGAEVIDDKLLVRPAIKIRRISQ